MAITMMNDDEFFVENVRRKMEMALLLSRVVEGTLPDILAAYTPLLAPIIPAVIGFENVQNGLGFGFGLALIYAVIVECLGLATTITALQFRAWNLANQPPTGSPQMAGERHLGGGQKAPFKLAVGMVVFYLAIVLGVNVALDSGSILQKVIKGAASLLSVIGAVTWALRNEQAKRAADVVAAKVDAEDADTETRELAERLEREEREMARRAQVEDDERAHRWKLEEEDRVRAFELKKMKAQKVSESAPKVAESFEKVAEPEPETPETYRNYASWRDVPTEERRKVFGMSVKDIMKTYKRSEKTAGNWRKDAIKEFGGQA